VLGDEDVALKAIEANSQMPVGEEQAADFGWFGGTTNSTAVILKDAKKLGLKTRFFANILGSTRARAEAGRRSGGRGRS
jgi:branched-chain amino acid transport system substrate-binding protein